jgi:hypothetical protein
MISAYDLVHQNIIEERSGHNEHKWVDQRLLLLELLFSIGLPIAQEELAPVK